MISTEFHPEVNNEAVSPFLDPIVVPKYCMPKPKAEAASNRVETASCSQNQ